MRKIIISLLLILGLCSDACGENAMKFPTGTRLEVITPISGDVRYLKLDQTTPQTFSAGTVTGTGFLNVTTGALGLDTNTYVETPVSFAPVAIYFGTEGTPVNQYYDIDGETWVQSTDGTPNVAGHLLPAVLTSMATSYDNEFFAIREISGAATETVPLTLQFNFTGITTFSVIKCRCKYDGSASHFLNIEIYNGSTWDLLATHSQDADFVVHTYEVLNPATYVIGGEVKFRYRHEQTGNSSHHLEIDYLVLSTGAGSGGGAVQTAVQTPSTATGNIEATNVQAAIVESEAEKVPYAGATGDVDLGIYDLDLTGTITTAVLAINDANTYIKEDGSSNMTFTDGVTGLKTLAELAAGDALDINALDEVTSTDIDMMVIADQSDSWNLKKVDMGEVRGGAGGGAPTDATYITQTADGDLDNEQALEDLIAGTLYSNGSGVISKATADQIEADLVNDPIDFGTGACAAAEFNLADGEFIEWGGDENITFDGTDFQITDSLDFGTNILTDVKVAYILDWSSNVGTIDTGNYIENVVDTLTATLGVGADANDVDTTSWGLMSGFDTDLFLDWDADAVINLTSDGTLELHSADWDISTTGAITNTAIDSDNNTITNIVVADTSITAGRSLTWSTNDMIADAELYTDVCGSLGFEDPADADDFESFSIAAVNWTITGIYAETDTGTITFDIWIDDGTPAAINGSTITATSGGVTDTSFAGDTDFDVTDRLDLVITLVSDSPNYWFVHVYGTKDD